jgi:hypothetical protein
MNAVFGHGRCEQHKTGLCSVEACTRPKHIKNKCKEHYLASICNTIVNGEPCGKKAFKDGKCSNHTTICKEKECQDIQYKEQYCKDHHVMYKCIERSCDCIAYYDHRCKKHLRKCLYPNCDSYAKKFCDRHIRELNDFCDTINTASW